MQITTREQIEKWAHDQADLCLKDYHHRIEATAAATLHDVIRGRLIGAFFLGAFVFGKGDFELGENRGPIGFSCSLD